VFLSQNGFLSRAGAHAALAARLAIGEIKTSRNVDEIAQLFNEGHKVLIQAKDKLAIV
jgi:hypothetical protein